MSNVVKNSKMSSKKSVTAKQLAKSNLTKRKNPDWDNLDRGYRYLTLDMKLPHDLAVAVMGNVVEESLGDYKSVLKNGGGRGLIQWDGRKAPSGRYNLWGSIWASVAKPANVYDSTTDTVKNYWAPWGGLKGEKVRLKFIKAPLKEKARIYAESYLRPGKPRIADRQLSTMQLDSIYNPRIKDVIVLKNGGQIRKMLTAAGGPLNLSPKDIKRGANLIGEYFLKGLGAFGKIATAPFRSQGPTSATIYKSKELLAKERTIENKSEELLGKAMTWASPLNYGVALATGNGLNARKGEEEVASWSPAWQAVGRLGELYVGPKAVKGVKSAPKAVVNTAAKAGVKPAKAAVVAREINRAVNKNTPKHDNRIHSIRFDDLLYNYSSNPLLELVNTIKTSPTNSYFMRAPSKIDIPKLSNGRFRHEVVGNNILPSGEVNGKFVSYGEPWKEFGFNEESALYEFPVGSKRGPNMMATDWKGRSRDYSVNEVYDYMKLEELLRKDLRLLNEQMGELFDKNYATIRNNLIETKYPLLKEHIDTSIYGGNQTVIPSLKWNFDNFLNSPFYKYTIDPISNQVQKELVISGVPNKSVEPRTSLKFFERKPFNSKLKKSEEAGVPKGERNFKPKWHVANYPGYLLKGLMKGSLLEKQLSKNGTININNIKAVINKGSEVEKAVVNKVLREKFKGLKIIDYNQFKKAVLDELIDYSKKPLTKYSSYGISRLGFEALKEPDGAGGILEYTPGVKSQTFTFESPRIPIGSSKHYDPTSLGHSRTFTTMEEPKTLYVMESQSDWGQKKYFDNIPTSLNNSLRTIHENNALLRFEKLVPTQFKEEYSRFLKDRNTYGDELPNDVVDSYSEAFKEFVEDHLGPKISEPNKDVIYRWAKKYFDDSQVKYLHDNYLQRQLQENLKYAAENGLTKMRYPTPETAAKIEGYQKTKVFTPKAKSLLDDLNKSLAANEKIIVALDNLLRPDYFDTLGIKLSSETENLLLLYRSLGDRTVIDFSPSHKTILKKYADFPKLFEKLFKGLKVRIVTDAKGNTWYEVDVPKGYLSREWQFKQGGKINMLEFLKNGGQIRKMQTAAGGPIKKSIKRLKDGYRYIPDEQTGGWTRISDNSAADVFATMEFTPKKTKVGSSITRKQSAPSKTYYSAYNPDDVIKGFNALTLGGLNNLSPTQWVRRYWDLNKLLASQVPGTKRTMTWSGFVNNWLNGNNGLVSEKFAQEHPYWSIGINGVGDAVALGGASNASKINKAIEYAPKATKVAFDVAKSNKNPLNFRNYGFLRDSRFYSDLDDVGYKTLMSERLSGNYPLTFAERRNYITGLKNDIQKGVDYAINEAKANVKAPLRWGKEVEYTFDGGHGWKLEPYSPEDILPLKMHYGTLKATKQYGQTPWEGNYGAFQNKNEGLFFPFRDNPNTLRTHSIFLDVGERIGTGAHETRHTVQKYFDVPLTEIRYDLPGTYGRYTNRNLPLDFKKKVNSFIADALTAGEWEGSLSEMDSELTGWSAKYGFPRYSQMSAQQKAQLHDLFLKRFGGNTDYNDAVYNLLRSNKILNPMAVKREVKKLDESKIGQILLGLEELGYRKHGGKMNIIKQFKQGSKIHIKEENKGKFTSYCGGKVTDECILKGKNSSNPAIRKRATFAANARKWKHEDGGELIKKHLEGAKLTFGLKLGNLANSDLGKSFISNGLSFLSDKLSDKLFNKNASSNLEIVLAAQEKELPTIDPMQIDQMIEIARNQYADPDNPNANGGDIFNSYIKRQITAPIWARQLEEHKKRLAAIDLLTNQAKSSAVGTFFNTLAQGGIEYLLNKYGTTEKADS